MAEPALKEEGGVFYRLIADHCLLNRTAVNKDTDRLVEAVRSLLGCPVLEVGAGEECLTWIIPHRWEVRKGRLSRLDGGKVVDFRDNPLHLWTHSVSFQGRVGRRELEKHLLSDPDHPDWTPYHYRNGYRSGAREWGFSLPHRVRQGLDQEAYLVEIETDLDLAGTMKVVDHRLEGEHQETIFFAAHTCHPGMATDGLASVAAGVELFLRLAAQKRRRYSYQLILGPEYFGAAGFLARKPAEEIARLKGGLYLDVLGNNTPLGYQLSFQGDSYLDRVVENVFTHRVGEHTRRGFRELWGNDEMFYNGAGFLIPTLGFYGQPHPEFHFDADNLEMVDFQALERSVELLELMVEVMETDLVPEPRFKGPVYLSRYDLYIDPDRDVDGYNNLMNIQILMDGRLSCLDIARRLRISFFFVRDFCQKLAGLGLVRLEEVNKLAAGEEG